MPLPQNLPAFQIVKPRSVLCDLPLFVKERIVRYADPVAKLSLQQCSKDFKIIVERSPKQIDRILLEVEEEGVYCEIDTEWLHQNAEFNREDEYDLNDVREAVQWFRRHAPSRVPVTLNQFIISSEGPIGERMGFLTRNLQQIFSTRRYNLSVNTLKIDIRNSEQELLKILPYLEPGALENIEVQASSRTAIPLDTVVELEQWKQAKRLTAHFHATVTFEQLKHFEQVSIRINHLTSDMVKQSVEHFLSTPGSRSLRIEIATADSAVIRFYLHQYGPANMEKQRVERPETDEYVEIETKQYLFAVRRCPIEIIVVD